MSSIRKPRSFRPSVNQISVRSLVYTVTTNLPRATSFNPTLSIALSKARPIKNSRERSVGTHVSHCTDRRGGDQLTIDTLVVGEGLSLLGFVPFDH